MIFWFFGCEQPVETEKNVTIINNIQIVWKGSLPTAPANPELGWAYYNTVQQKAFIWDGDSWEIIAQDGISIIWKGELPAAPTSPQKNWAYYNIIDGNSYIWDGAKWDLLAKAGRDGASGILLWLGSLSSPPANPSAGYAYYNTAQKISYIWNGSTWEILAKDGTDGTNGTNGIGIVWKGAYATAPANPQLNWAYFNTSDTTSYIWDGDSWEVLAVSLSGNTTVMVGISWKGNLSSAPLNPQMGWVYYNTTTGKTYIWDGSAWDIISQDGTSPEGFLITWKGGLSSAPLNPQKGWAYYNTSQKKSYIWDGGSWQILAQDGADGSGSGGGGTGFVSSGKIAFYKDGTKIDSYEIPTIDAGTTVTVEFEIRNIGSSVLYLTGSPVVELAYASISPISVRGITVDTSQTLSTIQPGASTTFKITYAPQTGEGRTYGNLMVRCSDASQSFAANFPVYRSARAPGMGITLYANSTTYQAIPYYYYYYYLIDPITYAAYADYMFDNVNIGSAVAGTSVSTSNFIISNSYGGVITTLNLTGTPPIQISGPDADCFSVIQPSVSSLAPQATNNTAKITFTPNSPGIKTATVTIPNNTVEAPNFSFTVTGTGLGAPVPGLNFTMTVNGTTYTESDSQHITSADFGSSPINGAAAAAITIQNAGTNNTGTVLSLTGNPVIQISGPNADCFTVTQPSSKNINANSSVTASIQFAPTSTGTKTAVVSIPNNSPDKPVFSFTITGTGTAAVPMMSIALSVNGTTYTEYPYQNTSFSIVNFGNNIELNSTITASLIVRNNAENNSGAVFNLTGTPPIQISGPDASSFAVIQPQVVSLSGGSNTTARIIFTPTSRGTKSATVTIPNNSPEKPNFSFTVTGTVPAITVPFWPKVYDGNAGSDRVACSLTDSQGNLYFIGYGSNLVNSTSGYDWWIKKFDSNGSEDSANWNKKISTGTSASYQPKYAIIDSGDNIIIADNNTTIKFAPDGTELWRISSGGALYADSADNIFIVKSSSITKYSNGGIQQWNKSYGGTLLFGASNAVLVYSGSSLRYLTAAGTEGWTKTVTGFTINAAVMDSSGNIYIAGHGTNLVNAASDQDVWIKNFDSSGTEITSGWDKKFDWGYNTAEYARQIFIYNSYVFVTGYGYNIYSASSGADGWIKQYTLDGQEQSTWNKVLDTDGEVNLFRIDAGGNLYFNSGSDTSAVIKKYSLTNVLLSTMQYNRLFSYTAYTGHTTSSRYVYSPVLMFDPSGNLYVSGYCSNLITYSSGYDWVIRKFDSAGVEQ
jgi:hypothetical protein